MVLTKFVDSLRSICQFLSLIKKNRLSYKRDNFDFSAVNQTPLQFLFFARKFVFPLLWVFARCYYSVLFNQVNKCTAIQRTGREFERRQRMVYRPRWATSETPFRTSWRVDSKKKAEKMCAYVHMELERDSVHVGIPRRRSRTCCPRRRRCLFAALCTYREMNQVSASKAGRCLLLTRRGLTAFFLSTFAPVSSFSSSFLLRISFARYHPSPSGLFCFRNSSLYRSRPERLGKGCRGSRDNRYVRIMFTDRTTRLCSLETNLSPVSCFH